MNNTYKFPVSQHGAGGVGGLVHLRLGISESPRTSAPPHLRTAALPPLTPALPHLRTAALLSSLALLCAAAPVHAKITDRDGDGIPRDWEILRGTSDADPTDALVDFDDDGLNTWMEYLTRGRPWGNYVLHRFPWKALPPTVPFSGITGTEIIGANRAGEYLVNCYDAAGPHTFLWSPGAPLAKSELTPIPVTLAAGTLWNDHAQVLLPGPAAGSGEIRSLRRWPTPPISVSWSPPTTPVALSNDGQLLLHWQDWIPLPSDSKRPLHTLCDNFHWTGTLSETLSFGRDPSRATLHYGTAADLTSGAWILGAWQFPSTAPETIAWRLRPAAPAECLPPLPRGLHGAAFHAAAAEKAVGAAHRDDGGPDAAVLLDARGWHTISGGVPGTSPRLLGVSDAGVVLGLNTVPDRYFLWKTIAVDLTKARPDTSVIPDGLTASGALYGLDFGKGAAPPRPVVFRPVPSVIGDGAADEPARPALDSDHDGIPDANEPAAGTSATLVDTDGNGHADLWDLLSRENAAPAASLGTAPGRHTGLLVFTPGHHPLARYPAARP